MRKTIFRSNTGYNLSVDYIGNKFCFSIYDDWDEGHFDIATYITKVEAETLARVLQLAIEKPDEVIDINESEE